MEARLLLSQPWLKILVSWQMISEGPSTGLTQPNVPGQCFQRKFGTPRVDLPPAQAAVFLTLSSERNAG